MIRFLFYLMILFSLSHAVVLHVVPSKELNATNFEADIFITKVYREKGIKPTRKAAKKVIYENRLLANAYLKEYKKIPNDILVEQEMTLDEILANLYIKKFQKIIKLNDDVLKSYYVMHQSEFIQPETLIYYPIEFNNFKEAYKFYSQNRDSLQKVDEYVKSHNIKVYKVPKNRIYIAIRDLFKNIHNEALLPPIFLGNKFVVFYVKDVLPKKRLKFDEVKDVIRKKLLDKDFNHLRQKLIKVLEK